jgi:hypothetical protein
MMLQKRNVLIFINIGFIVLGIALISIIDRPNTEKGSANDVRARASTTKNLTANATVVSTDPIKGQLVVTDLYFTDESRSGEAKNLGTWIVRTPATFNFSTVTPGTSVVIGVDTSLFKISNYTFNAASITPVR